MKTIIRIPKVQLALILICISFSALLYYPLSMVINIVTLSVLFTVGSDFLLTYFGKRKVYVPYAAVVTGLIIALTINPNVPWHGVLLISVFASSSKHFIQAFKRHIFNPAAFGLVAGNILLRDTASWWGVSFQVLKLSPFSIAVFVLLLLPVYVSGIRLKRIGSISVFLLTYSIFLLLLNGVSFLTTIVDPTVLFFALTMLPDPMTSPVDLKKQIVFGGLVAVFAIVYFYLPLNRNQFVANFFSDGLLPFLLIGNAVFFRFR